MIVLKILGIIAMVLLVIAVLYLLAIMPKMFNRADITPFQGRFYAHRGLFNNKSEAPENSYAAFKKAVEAGYGIELDIHLSKDKVPVIMHDKHLQRACGFDGLISDFTVAELKEKFRLFKSDEKIPTLAEVLELVDGKVPLIIEFKEDLTDLSLCEVAAPMLDKYKGVWCMESFNPLLVRWYRKHRPNIMRGQLAENVWHDPNGRKHFISWCCQNLLFNFLTKPDFIAFDHREMDMLSFTLTKKLYHINTFAWTIKSQEQLENAKKKFDFFIFDSFIPQ